MTTYLAECDSLAAELGRRATARDEHDAVPNMRAAVVAAGCVALLIATAVVL